MNQKLNNNEISLKDYIEWKLNVDVFKLEKKIKRETQEREYFL